MFRLQPPAASRNEFFIVGACYFVNVGLTTTYVGVCMFGAGGGGGGGVAIKDALEGPAVYFYVYPETNGNRKNKNLSSFSSFCGCCCCCWGGGGGGTYHIR